MWNVFQSSYLANSDKSVSQADYTKNMACPAYSELIKKHGGERSEDWAVELACMIKEHSKAQVAISTDIAKHGGKVARVIASHKMTW